MIVNVIVTASAVAPCNNSQPSQSRIPCQSTGMICTEDRSSIDCQAEDQVIKSRPVSSA